MIHTLTLIAREIRSADRSEFCTQESDVIDHVTGGPDRVVTIVLS